METAERNLRKAIAEVFGRDSHEFKAHEYISLEGEQLFAGGSDAMYQAKFREAIPKTAGIVEGLIATLLEQREDLVEVAKEPVATMTSKPNPRLFIGSSSEGLHIAEQIQYLLDREVESTIWSQGVFGLSTGTLEAIVGTRNKFDFSVLVLTGDDLVTKRDKALNSPRDNVIFELGFFIGALGRERTFIVFNRDEPPDLPSDLAGVTAATYGKRGDGNMRAALGPACRDIKDAIKRVLGDPR